VRTLVAAVDFQSPVVQSFFHERFSEIFSYFYAILVFFTLLLSISAPIEKAMVYFRAIGVIFSVLTLACFVGVIGYMAATGMDAYEMHWVESTNGMGRYVRSDGEARLSKLTVAGTIMLSVYLLPFLLRPLDFLLNLNGYVVGLLTYLVCLPMFATVM